MCVPLSPPNAGPSPGLRHPTPLSRTVDTWAVDTFIKAGLVDASDLVSLQGCCYCHATRMRSHAVGECRATTSTTTGQPAAMSHRRMTRPRSQTTTGSLRVVASSSISRRGQTPHPTTTPTSRSGATAPRFSTCSLQPTSRSFGGERDRPPPESLHHRLLPVLPLQTQQGATPPPIGIHGFTPWAYKYVAPDGPHQGVETEWETSQLASSYNAYFDADACCIANMANAAFFQHYPTRTRYVQVGWRFTHVSTSPA